MKRLGGLQAIGENGLRVVVLGVRRAGGAHLTMCRTECIGSDMTFTLAVTDMPVVPTSSSTSSRRYAT